MKLDTDCVRAALPVLRCMQAGVPHLPGEVIAGHAAAATASASTSPPSARATLQDVMGPWFRGRVLKKDDMEAAMGQVRHPAAGLRSCSCCYGQWWQESHAAAGRVAAA